MHDKVDGKQPIDTAEKDKADKSKAEKDKIKTDDKDIMEIMVCIGTIGHVDHGKTSLTSAITRLLDSYLAYDKIDDGQEEKARGITIVAKHVLYTTKKRSYTHVDCPGHADYIKNMIVGSSQFDIAILVVAGPDGVMPQTREHLNLISSIGVPSLVIFFNKADMIDDEDLIALTIEETLELAAKYGYKDVKYVLGSATIAKDDDQNRFNDNDEFVDPSGKLVPEFIMKDGKKVLNPLYLGLPRVKELMDIVDTLPIRPRELDKPFLMQVEDVLSVTGRGTVATGRVIRGVINVNQEVDILGHIKDKITTTVTCIEMFYKSYPKASAKQDVGLLLRGVDKKSISRGCKIAAVNSISVVSVIKCLIYVNSAAEHGRTTGFRKTYKPQFHIDSADVTGSFIEFGDDLDIINPGEWANVTIKLEKKQALEKDITVIIRESGKTVAVGKIIEIVE